MTDIMDTTPTTKAEAHELVAQLDKAQMVAIRAAQSFKNANVGTWTVGKNREWTEMLNRAEALGQRKGEVIRMVSKLAE